MPARASKWKSSGTVRHATWLTTTITTTPAKARAPVAGLRPRASSRSAAQSTTTIPETPRARAWIHTSASAPGVTQLRSDSGHMISSKCEDR